MEVDVKRKLKIERIILENFRPHYFAVLDVSEQHRGHKNFKEDVESHFEIVIVSDKFKYLKKIDRHRMINKLLKDEFLSDLHSVTIKAYTDDEFKSK